MNVIETKAQAVTIFLDRALVDRTFQLTLEPGETVLTLKGLGCGIIESSMKVHIPQKEVTLISSTLKTQSLWEYKEDKHREIWSEARLTFSRLLEILDEKVVFDLEDQILNELRDYIKESLNPVLLLQSVSVAKLREALSFVEERLTQNTSKLLDLKKADEDTHRKLYSLQAELKRITSLDRKIETVVEVCLKTDVNISLDAGLSYVLGGVSWNPVYDADLDTQNNKVNFRYYGQVLQTTTEVWENVSVNLSTAAVELSPLIPEIYPLTVSSVEQKRTKTVVLETKGIESLDEDDGTNGGDETPFDESEEPQTTQGLISALFPIGRPVTLPSDGMSRRVPILTLDLDTLVGYETVPAQFESVYLRGQFTNSSTFPFLSGAINLYRNGSFVGKAGINYTPVGKSVICSFGIDDDLKVKRIIMEDFYKPAEGLMGKNIYTQSLRYYLYNFKKEVQTVTVKEGIFVSELAEVAVKLDETTSAGYELDKDGILSWTVTLPANPAMPQSKDLKYTVESNKAFDLKGIL